MPDIPAPPDRRPGRWWSVTGPLRERAFARYFTAQCLSFIGDAMVMATLPLALLWYGLTPGAFGIVLTVTSLARVLGLVVGGVLADRFRRDVLLIAGDGLRAGVQFTVVALLLSGVHAIVPLAGLYLLFGIGTAIFVPASQGLIAQVTTDENRVAANGLIASAENLAMIVVPGIAAALLYAADSVFGLMIDGASYVLSAIFLATLRSLLTRLPAQATSSLSLRPAWELVRHAGWLRNGTLTFTAVNSLGFAPFLVLTPVLLSLAREEAAWGVVLGAQAAGAVVGGAMTSRLRLRRPLVAAFGSCVTWAPLAIFVAVGAPVALIALAAAATGISSSFLTVQWSSAIQGRLPADQVGRVAALSATGSLAVQPLAYSGLGLLAATSQAPTALLGCSALLTVLVGAACASAGIRRFGLEPHPERAGAWPVPAPGA